MNADAFIPTRRSLLSRLKSPDDDRSWREFFQTYGGLIKGVASKAGLSDAEAQDVLQETLIIVARKIPGFNYDPALGSFKSWLLLITRRRIEKQLKKRLPRKVDPASAPVIAARVPALRCDDTQRTATVERVPDPGGFDLERIWQEEWEQNLQRAALARVKAQVKPKQFQMFDLYALKEWPVKDVARAMGVTMTHVYVNKHRVAAILKKELTTLVREAETGNRARQV